MNAVKRLKSEVDEGIAKKAFDLLRSTTRTFERWSGKELQRLIEYCKILSFQK
jgi:hypothetical protein